MGRGPRPLLTVLSLGVGALLAGCALSVRPQAATPAAVPDAAAAVAAPPAAAGPVPAEPGPPFPPLSVGDLDRLTQLLRPWLAAAQVQLPPGTAAPLAEPASGWLPGHRVVAYYGNPLVPAMGILDGYPPQEMIAHLQAQCLAYAAADPALPVVPALDLVADVAQASPGADGGYRLRMSYGLIENELALARNSGALLILEVQVGRSSVAAEVPYFLPFLSQPDVALALDPEFDMPPGEVPGRWIGTMSAAEINWAVGYVSDLVTRLHLPPKMVIVHQFTPTMVPDARSIQLAPGVQFVMDTDGYGGKAIKTANYRQYIADQPIAPVRYGGIKLFYTYDTGLLSPAYVSSLQPPPSLVIYQ